MMARVERGDQFTTMSSSDGGGTPIKVTVEASLGFFELLQVTTDDGRTGTLGRRSNGKHEFWVRPLDEPEVPG